MKAYPAVVYTQTAIVAATAVADEVTMGAPDKAGRRSDESPPAKSLHQSAGFCRVQIVRSTSDTRHGRSFDALHHGRSMFDGDITNDSYLPANLKEWRILAFMQKISAAEDPELTARVGDTVPTRITAILADEQRVSREIDDIPGFVGKPMQRPDIDRKFRGNIGKRWPRGKNDAVVQSL